MKDEININTIVNYYVETSDKDFTTMLNLFNSKDYSWSLFIGHILIEKLLKAYSVKATANHPPFTHDLVRLAEISKLELSEEYLDWLDSITTFNINARYDSFKQEFYNKCTKEFTEEWIDKIIKIRTWVKKKL